MKNFLVKTIIAIFVGLIGLQAYQQHIYGQMSQERDEATLKAQELQVKVSATELLKEQKDALVKFTLKAMDMLPKSKISDAKRAIIAEKLAEIVVRSIPTQDAREQYISMVKIESNFDNSSKSPVGAVGIGQIMPGTFNETIKTIDIGAKPEDIYNEDVNLIVGAKYFNQLLDEQDSNPRLASIAYNGGSKTADKFKKMSDINQESANYALKTEHVKETVNKTK